MPRQKILLIGWDAADWRVIDPLLDSGQLPNLAKLVNRGVVGNLATLHPPYSPILWTSIATGKRPTQHGIHGFIEPTPDGAAVRPVSSLSRSVKAIWNIAQQTQRKSIVVGWYPSHPAEPIDGVMVSDLYCKAGDGEEPMPMPPGAVHPPGWRERLDELRLSPRELPGDLLRLFVRDADKVDQAQDKRLHMLARVVAENMNNHNAATEALEHAEWDLACIFYDGVDHLCHGFMRYHPPRLPFVSEADFALYGEVVNNCYRWHDAMLGRLLELAGPDVTTIIVSDHGFESGLERRAAVPAELAGPTADHRHFGIFVAAGPGIRHDDRVYGASLLDIAPTILHLMGLPVGRDMAGKVLVSALTDPRPVERIDSWEDVAGECGMHPHGARLDAVGAAEAMKQLVALGYVAPPAEDAATAVAEAILEQHYTLAQSHDDEGRPDLAAERYRQMLDLVPEDHRGHGGLVAALLALGRLDEASAQLSLYDSAALAAAERAQTALAAERARDTAKASPLASEDPVEKRRQHQLMKDMQAAGGRLGERMLLRIRLHLARGETDQALAAIDAFQSLIAANGQTPPAGLLAGLLAEAGAADQAMAWSHTALADDPQDFRALALQARLHHRAGRHNETIDAAAASLGLIYFQPALHAQLGEAQLALGQYEAAAQALRVAVLQAPGFLPAHQLLANLYTTHLDNPEQAARHRAQAQLLRDKIVSSDSTRRRRVREPDPASSAAPGFPSRPLFPSRSGATAPDGRAPVIVVGGLPRSGTSMLMQALAAGGIPPLTDGKRAPDPDNPRGYLEFEAATAIAADASWIPSARGHAVKLVMPLLRFLPLGEAYRLVLIQRDLTEVLASQSAMLERLGRGAANLTEAALAAQYIRQETEILAWLDTRPGIGVLPLRYDAVLADPAAAAAAIATFLGVPFDTRACADAIDPRLQRQKAT